MKTTNEILMAGLAEMQDTFSGFEFANYCRANGMTELLIKKGVTTSFLHNNAKQVIGTRKMWQKNVSALADSSIIDNEKNGGDAAASIWRRSIEAQINWEMKNEYKERMSTEDCVNFLKSQGYKVLKPTTTYEEVE